MIGGRHPEHLGGHDGGQRVGEPGHHVEAPSGGQLVDKLLGDLTDVLTQMCDAAGRERRRRQATHPSVLGRVEEQHLPHHHRGNRGQLSHAEGRQPVGVWGPGRLEVVKHVGHVRVPSDDPRVQIGIP